MDNKKIGNFIYELRKEKNMTQQDLADILGVTNKAVSKWERGEGYPEITLVPEIAKIFDVSVDELLSGEKDNAKIVVANIDNNNRELKKHIKLYKNLSYIPLGLSILGIILFVALRVFFIYYMAAPIGLIIATAVFAINILLSIILYMVFKNSANNKLEKYREENGSTIEYQNIIKALTKTHVLQLWFWVIPIFLISTHIIMFLALNNTYRTFFSLTSLYQRQSAVLVISSWIFSLVVNNYKKKHYEKYGITVCDYKKKSSKVWLLVLNILSGLVSLLYTVVIYESVTKLASFSGIEVFLFLIPVIVTTLLNVKRLKTN